MDPFAKVKTMVMGEAMTDGLVELLKQGQLRVV